MKEANLRILGELHRAGKYQPRRRVPQQPPALGASAWQHPGWDLPQRRSLWPAGTGITLPVVSGASVDDDRQGRTDSLGNDACHA